MKPETAALQENYARRMERALLSLDGLSVGDAFGECFLEERERCEDWLERKQGPPAPWTYTDDTAMAITIVQCLKTRARIEQDELAFALAQQYRQEFWRGYGPMAAKILQRIYRGTSWRVAAGEAFRGQGSCGNGGAMRSAPLGAYFAEDLDAVIREARASSEVTHGHPDGQTGAIAIALAAAWMVKEGVRARKPGPALIEFVLEHIPQTQTHHQLKLALQVSVTASAKTAALKLGNGYNAISSDTVPFCIWCAAAHPDSYAEALWEAVSVAGDIDTNCAIIGGIVALSAGRDSIPESWLAAREALPLI